MVDYEIIKDADTIMFYCECHKIATIVCNGSVKFYRDAICFIDNGLYCSVGLPRRNDDSTWEVRLVYQDCYQVTDGNFYYPESDEITDED